MKTTNKFSGAILTAAFIMFAQNSGFGQTNPSYLDDPKFMEYQAKFAAEQRIKDSIAWVNEQNEIAHAATIAAYNQQQISDLSLSSAEEMQFASMMKYLQEEHQKMIKKYADSLIQAEIQLASVNYAMGREASDILEAGNRIKYETQQKYIDSVTNAEITAACITYAKSRELDDMMDAAMEMHFKEANRYNDSIINAEILAASIQYGMSRVAEDAHNYTVEQNQLEAKRLLEEQMQAEILAMSLEYARKRSIEDSIANANGSGLKNETLQSVSTEDVNSLPVSIQIYPNPATDYITVELENGTNEQDEVTIIDMNGRIISKVKFNNNNILTVDVTTLSEGYYIVRYTSEKGDDITKKFVKQ